MTATRPKKNGRPKKRPEDKASVKLTLNFTPSEFAELERLREQSDLSDIPRGIYLRRLLIRAARVSVGET